MILARSSEFLTRGYGPSAPQGQAGGHTKFNTEWSGPHEFISVRNAVDTFRELSPCREYITHYERRANPILSKNSMTSPIETDDKHVRNANTTVNLV